METELVNTKELGQTGVNIAELAFGTWEYKGTVEALRRAAGRGGVLLDTAERYRNEHLVGQAIKGIRDRVLVATKVSPEHFRHDDVLMACDRSLKALGVDRIDLYQLHWPNEAVPIEETMSAMEHLVDVGKVRFIGVSRFPVPLLKRAQAALYKHKIVSHQLRYNLIDRNVEVDALPWCQANGITVLAFSPLAHGLKNILDRDPQGSLDQIAKATGKTEAQIALNWCLAKERVVPITTAGSLAHVDENEGATGWRLTTEQIQLLERKIRYQRPSRLEQSLRSIARRLLQRTGFGD
jgi:diketogulonate reductase-like aldo/keto reductase